jgi:thiol:disulfide interchange protein DsbD
MRTTKQNATLFLILLLTLIFGSSTAHASSMKIPLKMPMAAYNTGTGETIITIAFEMEQDWYTYAKDPGGMGKPTKVTGATADGAPIRVLYPKGIAKPDAYDPSITVNKYLNGDKVFIVLPKDASFPLTLRVDLLLCHPTKCVPVRRDLTFGKTGLDVSALPSAKEQPWWDLYTSLLPNADTIASKDRTSEAAYTDWDFTPRYLQPGLEVGGLLSAILMGLLAGLILNIMPCVLPVISLKLSAILNSSSITDEEERIHAFREHNIFFVLGVIAFFTFLAIVLGATGQAWGALFQNRWLVLGVAGFIMTLSLSLFGLFHLPVIDLKFGNDSQNPRVQAFFTGNLTTLLATPCSGPFLGGVLSWALVQGPIVIATVFISIGIGMSLPYILLAINPKLSRYLPKGGPWIEYVEKGIAFFLVATAFYLASIALGSHWLRFLAPLWAILFGGWLWIKTRKSTSAPRKWLIRTASLCLLIGLIVWTTPARMNEEVWEPFNATELAQRMENEVLFVEFTADWCPTCKALEATVLTPENITRWKEKYNIAFIKVDMTERTVEGEALLKALGSMSIPTAALFTPDSIGEPLVLRDLFTKTQLETIMKSWKK